MYEIASFLGSEIISIIGISILGGILGELIRECSDGDDAVFLESFVMVLGSAFIGGLCGLLIMEMGQNSFIAIAGAGMFSFLGYKTAMKFVTKQIFGRTGANEGEDISGANPETAQNQEVQREETR